MWWKKDNINILAHITRHRKKCWKESNLFLLTVRAQIIGMYTLIMLWLDLLVAWCTLQGNILLKDLKYFKPYTAKCFLSWPLQCILGHQALLMVLQCETLLANYFNLFLLSFLPSLPIHKIYLEQFFFVCVYKVVYFLWMLWNGIF